MMRSCDRRSSVLVIFAGLVASAVLGQKPPEAQAAYEPRSGPGAGQKFLEKLAGEWDVVKTFYPASGDPARSNGRCVQSMVHGGRFLKSDFVFDGPSGKTTGLGLIGFESESGRFTSVWTDSRSTRMSLRRSDMPFNGEEIVLYGRSLDGEAAGRPRSRTVTHLEDGGRRILHRQYVPGPDGKERLIMELEMTRR
ncbi:MAG TPA: DUF1579 family protein [Thermoanaerobaculia bacterium]|nr:DUF1579 family protein [Thermoanaerobaculia bacterium]